MCKRIISSFQEEEFTTSGELSTINEVAKVLLHSLAIPMLCALGLRGNLLVITAYFHQLTTSTRVNMFVLAVVDTITCGCGITWNTVPMTKEAVDIVFWFAHSTILFPVLLLAFMAIERLLAVRRPHMFTQQSRCLTHDTFT